MIGTLDLHSKDIHHLAQKLYDGNIKIISDTGVQSQLGAFAFKIIIKSYLEHAIHSLGQVEVDPVTLASFCAELCGILGAIIFLDMITVWYQI